MSYFFFVLFTIIGPIFIQVAVGYLLKKCTKLDLSPLTKVQFYIMIPALLFVKIYQAPVTGELLLVAGGSILLFVFLYLVSFALVFFLRYSKAERSAFINAACLYNSGNYCLPLIQLLFKNDPFAMTVQVIIMAVQNLTTNTFGVLNCSAGKKSIRSALADMLKIPLIYCVAAAVALQAFHIALPEPVITALDSLGSGLVPLALVTLGASLAEIRLSFKIPKVYLSIFVRLVISPILAYGITLLLGVTGIAAQVMVISSAAPTAVNAVLLAIEYDNEPEFISQAILFSTLLSAVTVTLTILCVFQKI